MLVLACRDICEVVEISRERVDHLFVLVRLTEYPEEGTPGMDKPEITKLGRPLVFAGSRTGVQNRFVPSSLNPVPPLSVLELMAPRSSAA